MRKMLVLLLALAVVGGAFAQNVTVSGDFRMDMGISTESDDDNDTDDVSTYFWAPGNRENVTGSDWGVVTLTAEGDKVNGWLSIRSDLFFTGGASVNILPGTLGLSVGYNRLPFSYWSSYDLCADNHWSFGASSVGHSGYLQFNIIENIFVGFAEGGKIDGESIKKWVPYIYAGYAHPEDGPVAFGLSAIATNFHDKYQDDKGKNIEVLALMARGYFKYLGIDNVNLGLNVAFYSAPQFTIFDINNNGAISYKAFGTSHHYSSAGKDDSILEALFDLGVSIPSICDIGLGIGIVMNLADEKKSGGSFGFKAGLDAAFNIGGFSIIPGVSFETYEIKTWNLITDKANDPIKSSLLNFGVAFCYSF